MASAARALSPLPPALAPSAARNCRLLFSTSHLSSSSSSPRAALSRSRPPPRRPSPLPLAAAAALEAETEEASPPEPVESQVASAVAEDAPKAEGVFAVVMIGSRQYIVIPGRFLYTQRLKGANVGDKIILNKVLLVDTKSNAYVGQPVVPNAVVHAVVEEQGLDPKVIVFKYKKKKNYRRNIGHRQPNTRLRITAIAGYQDASADPLPA